jgi:hypothetical protein
LKWGTGGINIDESRVNFISKEDFNFSNRKNYRNYNIKKPAFETFSGDKKTISRASDSSETNLNKQGRFPANFCHDGSQEVLKLFPTQGEKSEARFFYCPKSSKSERNAGLEGIYTLKENTSEDVIEQITEHLNTSKNDKI